MHGFEASLKVGETVTLKKSIFAATISLTYAGMPSPGIWSVVVHWAKGYQAMAWNLYLEDGQRGIDLAGGHLSVTFVDARSLRFRYEKP